MLLEKINCFFHLVDSRRIDNQILFRVCTERLQQKTRLFTSSALFNDVTEVRAVKTRNVFVRIAQLKLVDDVVADSLSGTGSKSRNWPLRKIGAQRVQLTVFWAEFVTPLR